MPPFKSQKRARSTQFAHSIVALAAQILLLSGTLTGCEELIPTPKTATASNPKEPTPTSATQYIGLSPSSDKLPVFSGYQIELGDRAEGTACVVPGAFYHASLTGIEGKLSQGEIAAISAAMAQLKTADVFLLTRSVGFTDDKGRECGTAVGRGISLHAVTLPPAHRVPVDSTPSKALAEPGATPSSATPSAVPGKRANPVGQ